MGVLEAAIHHPEVVQAMIQRSLGHRDLQVGHVGEVGQAQAPRFVGLAEDDLQLRPMHRPPGTHPTLQGPADTLLELGMAAPQLLEHGNRAQPRCRL